MVLHHLLLMISKILSNSIFPKRKEATLFGQPLFLYKFLSLITSSVSLESIIRELLAPYKKAISSQAGEKDLVNIKVETQFIASYLQNTFRVLSPKYLLS